MKQVILSIEFVREMHNIKIYSVNYMGTDITVETDGISYIFGTELQTEVKQFIIGWLESKY